MAGTPMIWWKYQCFHLIIMGVALDVVSQALWQQLKNMRRYHCHFLHDLLPEGLQRDLFSGDEEELALTLLDILEPLQYPLSVLQKARRHVLASPPLVASDDAVGAGRSTPCAFAEVTNVETADPACSAFCITPSFVCFDYSQLSIFESALHHPTLANKRFKFSSRQDN